MGLLDRTSLGETLDAVNDVLFWERSVPKTEKERAAKWIAGRCGRPHSYAGMPAPTDRDFKEGIRVFTGEKSTSWAGNAHVLGEEACRALLLLGVRSTDVSIPLDRATAGMLERLEKSRKREKEAGRTWYGEYCCARCTDSLWRHFTAGGLRDAGHDEWFNAGMKNLKRHRTGDGRWRRFPFYYTLLALSEMDFPAAVAEMRYAAPVCARLVERPPKPDDVFDARRRAVAERILVKC